MPVAQYVDQRDGPGRDTYLLFDSPTELVYRFLPDTTLTYVDDGFCRYMGKSPDELLGRQLLELLAEPAQASAREHVAALVRERHAGILEYEVRLADGSLAWQQWMMIPAVDARGRVVELTAFGRDVTTRKRAEEALARREAQLDEAQRLAQLGSWEWDVVAEQVTWSRELYRIYGLEPGASPPTNETIIAFMHPDDRARAIAEIAAACHEGRPYDSAYRIVRPDGEVRHVQSRGVAVLDEHGRTLRMYGTKQDITARKRADESLRSLQDLLKASIDALPEHIAILERDGTVLEVNAAWRRFAKRQHEGLAAYDVGANYLATCEAAALEGRSIPTSIAAGLRAVIAGDQDSFREVYGRPMWDPHEWVQVRITRFEHGGTLRLLVTREDVTELKQGDVLTPRQREIVRLLADGMTSKAIAATLHISVKTVETHRVAIMRKLELTSVAALVRYAIRHHIVEA